jgi:hypothetical protein
MRDEESAMKSLRIEYDLESGTIDLLPEASPEAWDEICERYDNDVQRIKSISDRDNYTALYACYDEDNRPVYYLVEEGEDLARMRRKTFLSKLGRLES